MNIHPEVEFVRKYFRTWDGIQAVPNPILDDISDMAISRLIWRYTHKTDIIKVVANAIRIWENTKCQEEHNGPQSASNQG